MQPQAAGTYRVLNPCRDCPEGAKKQANYEDEEGREELKKTELEWRRKLLRARLKSCDLQDQVTELTRRKLRKRLKRLK